MGRHLGGLYCLLLGAVLLLPDLASAAVSRLPLYLENAQLDPNQARAARNIAYFGVIRLGTPAENFVVCYDTGSTDLWLPSSECVSGACYSHKQYDPEKSSTSQEDNAQFDITYGTGEVAGYVSYDNLEVGAPAVTITGQGFGEAYIISEDFATTTCDGLFGLAFPGLTSLGVNPPFFNMIAQGLLDANEFSIWLNPNDSEANAGELIFGGRDAAHYTGDLYTVPVTQAGYWRVSMTGAAVGGQSVSIGTDSAILDSGTTGIITSTQDAENIHAQIPQLEYDDTIGIWRVDCSEIPNLPNISFSLNGQAFSVPASIWVSPLTDSLDERSEACTSSVIPALGSSDPMVLGAPFLRAWYSIHVYGTSSSEILLGASAANSTVAAGRRRRQ